MACSADPEYVNYFLAYYIKLYYVNHIAYHYYTDDSGLHYWDSLNSSVAIETIVKSNIYSMVIVMIKYFLYKIVCNCLKYIIYIICTIFVSLY